MGTYNPKITISSAPGIADNLYIQLCEATAPSVQVAGQLLTPPHNTSQAVQFTGLNNVIHLVTIYETSGTVAGGTIRANFSIDPATGGTEIRLPLFIYAGLTAGFPVGSNTYTDITLAGSLFDLEIRGAGTQNPSTEYTFDNVNGIIAVTVPSGYQTQSGECWVIHFLPIVVDAPPATPSATPFSTFAQLVSDTVLTSSDQGKGFFIQSGTSKIQITLPAASTVSSLSPWYFMSGNGLHVNAVIKASAGDTIFYFGGPVRGDSSKVVLGQWESGQLIPISTNGWIWIPFGSDSRQVGEICMSYNAFPPVNTILANGTVLSRTVYVRLWDYVQSLDPSIVVNDANWLNTSLNNFGRFSLGDGSSTFRIPDLTKTGFLQFVNGASRKAGSYQAGQVGDFTSINPIPIGDSFLGAGGGGWSGWVGRGQASEAPATFSTRHNIGLRNIPDNTGIYALIRI
jgi:hypothetical protein